MTAITRVKLDRRGASRDKVGIHTALSTDCAALASVGPHLLTRSKLVAMGAAVVNLALPSKIDVCSNPGVFDRKLVELGGAAALKRERRHA
jgi:hypothetical protein